MLWRVDGARRDLENLNEPRDARETRLCHATIPPPANIIVLIEIIRKGQRLAITVLPEWLLIDCGRCPDVNTTNIYVTCSQRGPGIAHVSPPNKTAVEYDCICS